MTDLIAKKRILVVEDDGAVRDLIAAYLGNAGLDVTAVDSGVAMQRVLESEPVDLLLLDLNLPDSDGLRIAQMVRARSRMGIIIVTERSEPEDRAMGLEIGADDYVTKPFFPRELLARVRNVLERSDGGNRDMLGEDVFEFGQWILDRENRRVVGADGRDAHLTPAEFDLLSFFVEHPQQLLSREVLAEAVSAKKDDAGDRSVDILISRLRKKLGGDEPLIETLRGHGYRLAVPVNRPRG